MMLSFKNKWRYIYLSPFVLMYIIRMLFVKFFFEKKIFILNTPLHGNLGDQAILSAEIKIIKDTLPGYKIITVPNKICIAKVRIVAKMVKNEPICVQGGGHLGDLWPKEDTAIRKILEATEENQILFFPQTFCSGDAEKYFKEVKPIFEKNKNLVFFARDLYSYKKLKKNLENKVFYSPDIVLYEHRKKYTKKNILTVCLRNDAEKTMTDTLSTEIMNAIKEYDFRKTDTVIDKVVFYHNRIRSIRVLMRKIGESRLLITDRLHGMIFAYLSKTPCLVFNSKSPKVLGVYKWLEKSDYIILHDAKKDIADEIKELYNKKFKFNGSVTETDFDSMKKVLMEIVE